MSGIPKTVKYIEDLEAKEAFQTQEHIVYYCPYCLEKEIQNNIRDPKPDTKGKLYVSKTESKGYCFRCNTALVSRADAEADFGSGLRAVLEPKEEIDPDSLPPLDLNGLPQACEVSEAMDYLKNRNPCFSEGAVKKLDFRWVEETRTAKEADSFVTIKRKGILVPIKYKDVPRSYQIRYLTTDKAKRFHTMRNVRLCYSPKPIEPVSDITICEGVFGAIACLLMRFPNPIALLGSSPSKLQLNQLRNLMPAHVNLCLDDNGLNVALMRSLKKNLKTMESYHIWDLNGDPEDFYKTNPNFQYKRYQPRKRIF